MCDSLLNPKIVYQTYVDRNDSITSIQKVRAYQTTPKTVFLTYFKKTQMND